MGHRRCANNIAPERQKSCATVHHAVIGIASYRTGSSRIPVSVFRNGHRALPQPSSFPAKVRQRSPKWRFCNLPKHILNYWAYTSYQCMNYININTYTGTPSGCHGCQIDKNYRYRQKDPHVVLSFDRHH